MRMRPEKEKRQQPRKPPAPVRNGPSSGGSVDIPLTRAYIEENWLVPHEAIGRWSESPI